MVVMDSEHRLHEGDRVRIRNHVDPSLYQGMSTIGNEGWIRRVREDAWGLPQVFIEWDKNHWTYNGAPDGWTFEEHFDIVKRMSKEKPSKHEIASQFADLLAQLIDDDEPEPQPEPQNQGDALRERLQSLLPHELVDDVEESEQTHDKAVKDVIEVIGDAEAFVVVAVNRVDHPKAENGVMVPHALTWADNNIAELLSLVHLAGVAAQSYQDLALAAIQNLSQGDES